MKLLGLLFLLVGAVGLTDSILQQTGRTQLAKFNLLSRLPYNQGTSWVPLVAAIVSLVIGGYMEAK